MQSTNLPREQDQSVQQSPALEFILAATFLSILEYMKHKSFCSNQWKQDAEAEGSRRDEISQEDGHSKTKKIEWNGFCQRKEQSS